MKRPVPAKQIDLVLRAIRVGAFVVGWKYLPDVLCLACRGSLTPQEMSRLILPNGRRVFVDSLAQARAA